MIMIRVNNDENTVAKFQVCKRPKKDIVESSTGIKLAEIVFVFFLGNRRMANYIKRKSRTCMGNVGIMFNQIFVPGFILEDAIFKLCLSGR